MTKISRNYRDKINNYILESTNIKRQVSELCLGSIFKAAQLIVDTFESGGKVMICGNGGSAADSQHMAGELVCLLNKSFERPALSAIALTTDTSIITAQANDWGFEKIFERQVFALGRPGDLLICISTSGNSQNILVAAKTATSAKIKTIALTGKEGKLQNIVDVAICVPSTMTQYIQESHIVIEHILCLLVEDHLFGKKIRYDNK